MKQYKQARKSPPAECCWAMQECLSEQWLLSAWDKASGQSPGESPASNPSAHSWSSGWDITKSHSEEPKPLVPSYILGNEPHINVILHFPQYSSNNCTCCCTDPSSSFPLFCTAFPPMWAERLPQLFQLLCYTTWNIIKANKARFAGSIVIWLWKLKILNEHCLSWCHTQGSLVGEGGGRKMK